MVAMEPGRLLGAKVIGIRLQTISVSLIGDVPSLVQIGFVVSEEQTVKHTDRQKLPFI